MKNERKSGVPLSPPDFLCTHNYDMRSELTLDKMKEKSLFIRFCARLFVTLQKISRVMSAFRIDGQRENIITITI